MAQSGYTIIIASNRGGAPWRFAISTSWLKTISWLGYLFVLFVFTAGIDYFSLVNKGHEHDALVSENAQIKSRSLVVRGKLEAAVVKIANFKEVFEKLKIITKTNVEPAVPVLTPALTVNQPLGGPLARQPASLDNFPGNSLIAIADKALSESQAREQEILNLWDLLSERQSTLVATPTVKPTHGYYSSPFGFRIDPINGRPLLHAGVDIAAPYGSLVFAPADGVISYAGYENGYGNLVSIDHGYGVITRYGHNSRILVHVGQRVHRWEAVSAVGSTGHSTGAHLHYEVLVHGIPVDPTNYILQEN